MKPTKLSIPEVFIIESLTINDLDNGLTEGEIICKILKMGDRKPQYKYVETRDEFQRALQEFLESNYRYLHISSHGAEDHFLFQFGEMYFNDFRHLVRDKLENTRVFVSACEVVSHMNHELANAVLRETNCYSLIGSSEEIAFDDAAMFWSTFYYLAYKGQGPKVTIDRELVLRLLKKLTGLFTLEMNYYSFSRSKSIKLTRYSNGKQVPIF